MTADKKYFLLCDKVPGMIRALPTQVKLPNGQVQSLKWGIQEVSSQQVHLKKRLTGYVSVFINSHRPPPYRDPNQSQFT